MTGCKSKYENTAPDINACKAALKRVETVKSFQPESETEETVLKRFEAFYADYSAEAIKAGIRDVYADEAWFADPFHVVEGIDDIEHYFVVMAEPVESCTFTIDSVNRSGKDYFFRWTMVLHSKAAKGGPIEALGVSHVRFNEAGKIIYQHDYWDTSVMMDRLPVVGYWTRLVKNRIAKGLEK